MTNLPHGDRARDALYETIVDMPLTWLNTAQDLKRSADLLSAIASKINYSIPEDARVARGHMTSYCLLMGFAFENIVKGVHIAEFSESDSPFDSARSHWTDGGHGFPDVAQSCVVDLSNIEIQLLHKLQEFVVWSGKYAIPSKPGRFSIEHWLSGDLFPTNEELDAVQPLFSRLEAIILKPYPKV